MAITAPEWRAILPGGIGQYRFASCRQGRSANARALKSENGPLVRQGLRVQKIARAVTGAPPARKLVPARDCGSAGPSRERLSL